MSLNVITDAKHQKGKAFILIKIRKDCICQARYYATNVYFSLKSQSDI